ncbi:MAG: DMT family transporter, partial [Kiloniellales bacterium]|nr:DMT family transporter [Kiloniellales bacterium]
MKLNRSNTAKLACLYAGAVWGIYWVPLRLLDSAGIPGVWATVVFYLVPVLLLFPLYLKRKASFLSGGRALHLSAGLAGLALVLYANALIYTEVVRAIVLYYLTPLWGFLFARFFIGEKITPLRWVAIALGLIGLFVIFSSDSSLPLPRNLGDWMGLAAGITWAAASTAMLVNDHVAWQDFGLAYF